MNLSEPKKCPLLANSSNPDVSCLSDSVVQFLVTDKSANSQCSKPLLGASDSGAGGVGANGSTSINAQVKTVQCLSGKTSGVPAHIKKEAELDVKRLTETNPGPANTLTLLSNTNIDKTLQKFSELRFPKFYHHGFVMSDFETANNADMVGEGRKFATINVAELHPKYDTFGVVMNTDVYRNSGKHWICIFIDMRTWPRVTIEFFNSSGREAQPTYASWMRKQARNFAAAGAKPEIIHVTRRPHQRLKTECGVYSLFYLLSRLGAYKPEGPHSVEYFNTYHIRDEEMHKFRTWLFNSEASNVSYSGDSSLERKKFDASSNGTPAADVETPDKIGSGDDTAHGSEPKIIHVAYAGLASDTADIVAKIQKMFGSTKSHANVQVLDIQDIYKNYITNLKAVNPKTFAANFQKYFDAKLEESLSLSNHIIIVGINYLNPMNGRKAKPFKLAFPKDTIKLFLDIGAQSQNKIMLDTSSWRKMYAAHKYKIIT